MRNKRFGRFVSIDIHPDLVPTLSVTSSFFPRVSIIFHFQIYIHARIKHRVLERDYRGRGKLNRHPTCFKSLPLLFLFTSNETPEEEFRLVPLFDPSENH